MNKTKIITVLVSLIFLLFIIFALYNNYKHNQYIDAKEKQSFRTIQQIVDGKIIFFRKLISKRVKNGMMNNKAIKKAIIDNDQAKYKETLNYIFKTLKRENRYIKTLHFISPENISLHRAHKPSKFGDDLTDLREIVKETNIQKRPLYGFESGLYQLVYRLNIPITYNNIYYGVIEVGVDPFIFVDDLTVIDKYLDTSLLINNKYARVFKDHEKLKDTLLQNDNYTLIGESELFKKLFKENKIFEKGNIKYKNEQYKLYEYELYNFNAKSTGKLIFALNITDDYNWKKDISFTLVALLILLSIVAFIIVYYTFAYYEKKINTLKEAEKQYERTLHQQSKMASMGEMIGNIAHQWRQPLSIISTAASGMKVQFEYGMLDEKKINEATDNIVNQTEYMSKTIDDFRDFFKSDKEKVSFLFNSILEKNLILVQSSLKNHYIKVITDFDKDVILSGFQNELTQAILNILNNAKDQLIKHEDLKKVIKLETQIKDKYIVLSICDNAGGVSEDIIHKIFEPYFTTKHQSQGTGIGLYMTHEIIAKHFHGTIDVSNEPLKYEGETYIGAKFTIKIPYEELS